MARKETDWVIRLTEEICPHEDPLLRARWAQGFLSSFIGTLIHDDSRNLVKFKLAVAQKLRSTTQLGD